MTNLLRSLQRSSSPISFDDWANYFSFNGSTYPVLNQSLGVKTEDIQDNFAGYVQGAYKANGIVFACQAARLRLFSEARFQFRRVKDGRPGDLFGTPALQRLETPWVNGTTGDLLARAIQDADLAGNFYGRRLPNGVQRLRPDWVTIVLGSKLEPDHAFGAIDAELAGYIYHPGGRGSGRKPVGLLPFEVAHFAPVPDPLATYRGMSWLTPVIREVLGDQAATTHKLKFFEQGATPNLVVSFGENIQLDQFQTWIDAFQDNHEGFLNAYKTLYLGAGADAKAIGADLKQADFKVTQGAGETRIAAAAGVPPIVVGLSEGLAAATYSNYGQARRSFSDGTMRQLWRSAAGSFAPLVDVPKGAELWYDDRDIAFLQEDQKDAAEIQQTESISIKTLIDAGYKPDTVVAAITSGDWSKLQHTGLFSVQLQPPNSQPADPAADAGRALALLIAPHLAAAGQN